MMLFSNLYEVFYFGFIKGSVVIKQFNTLPTNDTWHRYYFVFEHIVTSVTAVHSL